MMAGPIRFVFGYKRILAKQEDAAAVISLCMELSLTYTPVPAEDGLLLEISLSHARKLEAACAERGIGLVNVTECGIPRLLGRYRRRYGIFAGTLCFALIIFLSGRVIWDVRIDGAKNVPESEVISLTIKPSVSKIG